MIMEDLVMASSFCRVSSSLRGCCILMRQDMDYVELKSLKNKSKELECVAINIYTLN